MSTTRIGIKLESEANTRGHWGDADIDALRLLYAASADGSPLGLAAFATSIGRGKENVCRKARELGLTNAARPKKRPEDKIPRGQSLQLMSSGERISLLWSRPGLPRMVIRVEPLG